MHVPTYLFALQGHGPRFTPTPCDKYVCICTASKNEIPINCLQALWCKHLEIVLTISLVKHKVTISKDEIHRVLQSIPVSSQAEI